LQAIGLRSQFFLYVEYNIRCPRDRTSNRGDAVAEVAVIG
jgi:hypothetical protein